MGPRRIAATLCHAREKRPPRSRGRLQNSKPCSQPTRGAVAADVYKVYILVYNVHMSRDRIFTAAKAVLDRDGLPGLTIRKVADRAGLSPMAMYRHFADKDALLNALMDDGLAAWEKIARSIRAADSIEWLIALGEAFLEFALTEPHRFDAAFFLPAPRARRYPEDFVAGRSPVVAMALVRIDQAKADGRLGDKPALEVALALSGLVQGLVSMYRANRFSSEKQFRALYRVQVRHCLEGFCNAVAGSSR
jgi:AcrR family transcriptional regulator